jgi:post-segregation antitoxin (ccd killing protein)
MTTLQLKLTLPDQLAKRAKKAGLLNAQSIETLLREAMRKKALARFLQVSERVAAAGVPAMSEEEIQAEVDAVRRARRKRLAPGR